ncbi:MAG TPA: HIRAN domain-containing protein [Pirellulales bacterium]|nr:HIRAN domain-containing protein [Pirellulales bacterium]
MQTINDVSKVTGAIVTTATNALSDVNRSARVGNLVEVPTIKLPPRLPMPLPTDKWHGCGHFHQRVAGVTFKGRQAVIKTCTQGERLWAFHDPENKHSNHAIVLSRQNGQQIGHVPDDTAADILRDANDGKRFLFVIAEITGGGWFKRYGCNFVAVTFAKTVTDDRACRYLQSLVAGGLFQRVMPWV